MSDFGDLERPEINISPISFADFDSMNEPDPNLNEDHSRTIVASSSQESSNFGENESSPQPGVSHADASSPKISKDTFWSSSVALQIKDEADEQMETQTITAPLILPSNTDLKIKVNKLKITAKWKWIDGGDDRCGICRAPFEGCCIDCKMPGDDCPLVVGACKHPFHIHCIVKWTNSQQKAACPLCRQEWRFQSAE